MSAKRQLPDFGNPPVVEVSVGVQFEPIAGLRAAEMGLFWADRRDRFPHTEEHFELDSVLERFESPQATGLKISSSDRPPSPRMWFLNDAHTELIQIQRNRFIHNWREVPGDDTPYPRYPHIRDTFKTELKSFRGFLRKEKLGRIKPTQCEVTYVNHISSGSGWEEHGEVGRILTLWSDRYSDDFLPKVEDAVLTMRYLMTDQAGNRVGRLHVKFQPAHSRKDGRPVFVLTLTARGAPVGTDDRSVLQVLDVGHEWIVRGFASTTTPSMHKVWERKDA